MCIKAQYRLPILNVSLILTSFYLIEVCVSYHKIGSCKQPEFDFLILCLQNYNFFNKAEYFAHWKTADSYPECWNGASDSLKAVSYVFNLLHFTYWSLCWSRVTIPLSGCHMRGSVRVSLAGFLAFVIDIIVIYIFFLCEQCCDNNYFALPVTLCACCWMLAVCNICLPKS